MKPIVSCDKCLGDKVQCRFKPTQYDRCQGCTALGIECSWTHVPKPELTPDTSYIKYLESKVKDIEKYLKRNRPDIKTKKDIDCLLEDEGDTTFALLDSTSDIHTGQTSSGIDLTESPTLSQFIRRSRMAEFGSKATADDENTMWEATSANFRNSRYYGHSSTCILSRDAMIIRYDCQNGQIPSSISGGGYIRPEFWNTSSVEMRLLQQHAHDIWEAEKMLLNLPSDDLMPILLDAYFRNTFFPVIHRQLFEKQLREGLHKQEKSFLRLVLLVCANGARWCKDPRVLDESCPVSRSAGHRWFRQFEMWHRNLVITNELSLWDAQILVLIGMYLCGSSATYGAWVTVGAALRMMQHVGSHRKKFKQTLESELHKRCFWSMLMLDRLHSFHFGRNGAISDSDFDIDEVLEVDDELWPLDPDALPPVQPSNVTPKLQVFNQSIALMRIAGRCLQTIYALDQTKRLLGIDRPEGLLWVVNDINSQLLNWAHGMPVHLQLPDQPLPNGESLFSGFINMWAYYYELVISINRPFISKTSELSVACIAICREAAKGFSKMARTHCRLPESRSKFIPGLCYPAFSSAMVLAIDLMSQSSPKGPNLDYTEFGLDILEDTYTVEQKERDMMTCIEVLEDGEAYFQIAGKLRDLIREFERSLRLRRLASQPPSSKLSNCIGSGSTTAENGPKLVHSTNLVHEIALPIEVAPEWLNEPNMPFDILLSYDFADHFFLAPGIACGFPQESALGAISSIPSPWSGVSGK
ncbi:Fungal specific transcription factor domain [Rhizoctonia solani]|uniref:Fungal specific transcription factor domain n=1 Tax=Rhizoctonia solani TaxID=456999 RepID=A0A8H7IAF1_9AGAM|nr:Fungal specific transcription factor domain [Rhizoctonia solani]